MAESCARLHVLLASHAPVGLVIRRGPSKQVATYAWDRTNDEFRLGQWMKGRIYERRSDLSPDGRFFLYFSMDGRWESETKGAWTAISRSPYLKALALFPKGDCWNGGGMWTGSNRYWLNDGYGHDVLRESHEVQRDAAFVPVGGSGNEDLGVYYPRLFRDGWELVQRREVAECDREDVFERPLRHRWVLRKIAHTQTNPPRGKGCTWDEHQLVHAPTGRVEDRPDWEWADRDGDRLVWASRGALHGGVLGLDGLAQERELLDFTPLTFEPVAAPY